MDSKAIEHSTDKQKRNWSDYVEVSKYFNVPVKHCLSTPCLGREAASPLSSQYSILAATVLAASRPKSTACELARPNLSLSWQLACNPVESTAQRHCKICRQAADLMPLSSGRAKPAMTKKKMNKKQDESGENNGDKPKIVVVDATTLRAYWNQQRGDGKGHDCLPGGDEREPMPKKTVLKIKNPYAIPLCSRPTTILGPQLSAKQEQEQQRNRYPHPRHFQAEFQARRLQPLRHLVKEQYMLNPKYAVPLESVFSGLKKGRRYCGNFYYK